MPPLTVAATGDSFITRRIHPGDRRYGEIAELIATTDVRFTNFEMTAHDDAGHPAAVSGGTWAIADPGVVDDLAGLGFNLMSWANNHAMDYSAGGLLATFDTLDRAGVVHAGAGPHLARASAPAYLELGCRRIGLVAVTSTFDESWVAGDQRPDLRGRPGVNALHHDAVHKVTATQLASLREIARSTRINAEFDHSVAAGYRQPVEDDDTVLFGGHLFASVDDPRPSTAPRPADQDRVNAAIRRARAESDYVIVSLHAHEMRDGDIARPAEFVELFARACVDAGADAVVGHGPHLLRGIEIHRGRPIFYSLGDFVFQNETVRQLPSDFYAGYGLGHDDDVSTALATRSAHWTRGYAVQPEIWSSVVALWQVGEDGATEIRLHPIGLGFDEPHYRRGVPRLVADTGPLERLRELSRQYGTEIAIEDGVGVIRIPRAADRGPAGEERP